MEFKQYFGENNLKYTFLPHCLSLYQKENAKYLNFPVAEQIYQKYTLLNWCIQKDKTWNYIICI